MVKVVIVVPYVDGTEDLVLKLKPLLEKRAGVPVEVHCVLGTDGWINTHNYYCNRLATKSRRHKEKQKKRLKS